MWSPFKWAVNISMHFMKSTDMPFSLRFHNALCDGCSKIYSSTTATVYTSTCYMLGILSALSSMGTEYNHLGGLVKIQTCGFHPFPEFLN